MQSKIAVQISIIKIRHINLHNMLMHTHEYLSTNNWSNSIIDNRKSAPMIWIIQLNLMSDRIQHKRQKNQYGIIHCTCKTFLCDDNKLLRNIGRTHHKHRSLASTYQNKSFPIKKAFFMIISIGYLLAASRFNCALERHHSE